MIPKITQPPDDGAIMFPNEKDDDGKLQITLTLTNQGKTPAIGVSGLYGYSSEKIVDPAAQSWILDLPPISSYENMRGGNVVVLQAPGSIYVPKKGPRLHRPIDKEFLLKESPAWARKERCLCVRGWYEYRDIFGQSRTTRFCYAYQDVSQIETAPDGPNFPFRFRKAGPDAYNEIAET